MKRVDRILEHDIFRRELDSINATEKERVFCNHDLEHLMDVARIAWILNLEYGTRYDREVVYATALLHDIGKGRQYRDGIAHEIAGVDIAVSILRECGFAVEEIDQVRRAILSHRDASVKEEKSLRGILYRADKASRPCFLCRMAKECNWPQEKKNLQVLY